MGTMRAWLRRVLSDWLNPPHEHLWEAQSAQYSSVGGPIRARNVSQEMMDRLILGTTLVTYRCAGCKDHKQDLLLGKVTLPNLGPWKDAA